MIAKLTGKVDSSSDTSLILDVNGVGYKVFSSTKTLSNLPLSGETISLTIETVIREDAFILYGFSTVIEQDWFLLLTTVQGVGARVALAILSACDPSHLAAAIASGDKAYITQADGVGPKLATRLLSELKDKVGGFALNQSTTDGPGGSESPQSISSDYNDAISALTNFGYKRADVVNALNKASKDQDNLPLDGLIKEGLKALTQS